MAVGFGFRDASVNEVGDIISQSAYMTYQIVHIKEAIWLVMAINFSFMYVKRRKAEKLFLLSKFKESKELVTIIPKVLLPINIFLGLVAIWLGVTLRGF